MSCTIGQALRIAEDLGDDRLRVETMVFIAMRQDIVGELERAMPFAAVRVQICTSLPGNQNPSGITPTIR